MPATGSEPGTARLEELERYIGMQCALLQAHVCEGASEAEISAIQLRLLRAIAERDDLQAPPPPSTL